MNIEELRSSVVTLQAEVAELSTIEEITPQQDARLNEALDELEAREAEVAAAETEERRLSEREARLEQVRSAYAANRVTGTPSAPNFIKPTDVYDYDVRSLRDAGEARERVMRVLDDGNVTKHLDEKIRA